MKEFSSCKLAMEHCASTQKFAVAHLYKEEKTMNMHIHDCYEIYYSISGGKQFLIDNKFYSIESGDLFIINQYESHYLTQIDQMIHERIVLSIHPEYVKRLSSDETDLDECFKNHTGKFQHKISLNKEQQNRFLYYVNKITDANQYAHDILEEAAFLELLVMINSISKSNNTVDDISGFTYHTQVHQILAYINQNITSTITLETLSNHFYLSQSYICRVFKGATGTTINKYIIARRISIAKALLNDGASVTQAYEQSGFNDYNSFYKSFIKAVGITPKKYSQCSIS